MPTPDRRAASTMIRPQPAQTHEDLEREHNAREHARHAHRHGAEFDTALLDETMEPWPDYDLGVMPRGV